MAEEKKLLETIAISIVGSGGAGALTAGTILLEAAGRAGWYGIMGRSVGPQIRGGEAAALVRLSSRPVECMSEAYDLLIAMDWNNAERFAADMPLAAHGLVVSDPEGGEIPEVIAASGATMTNAALKALAKEIPGGRENMIAAGIAAGIAGIPAESLMEVVDARLLGKGEAVAEAGRRCIEAGMAQAATLPHDFSLAPAEGKTSSRWLITGNEAAGLGVVRGGVRFAAAYPITPATEILEWLAPSLERVGGALVQAEDELASINMAIGASFGGRAAVTATSGPGLALMIEALGLATASEVPVVVIDVMRGGPSTGIPTKSEQSDLNIAVYGCHGDAPHVVVAPLNIADCLFTAQWAVYLAETMQVPVIMLSDQALGQARALIDAPANVSFIARRKLYEGGAQGEYERYALTADGISPMALPGTAGGQYTADGLTHTVRGVPSSKSDDHLAQLDKRRDKIAGFNYGDHWADAEGEGDTVILTWGSLSGAAREAMHALSAEGISVRLVAMRLLSPFPEGPLLQALEDARRILVVEQTHSGQFHRYLRAQCDLPGDVRSFHRPGPKPIGAGEICTQIRDWIS